MTRLNANKSAGELKFARTFYLILAHNCFTRSITVSLNVTASSRELQ